MTALTHTFEANPHWLPRNPKGALAHIPGEDGWPLVGNTVKILANPLGFGLGMIDKYGLIFRSNAFGSQNVQLFGPDANELVLFDRDKLFSSEQGWGPLLNLLFPRGLMLMDFDKHRSDRKALSVAFKPEPMRHYAEALNQGVASRIPEWSGRTMPFYPAIKQLTLDLAATSFLGIPWGPDADKINQAFVDMVQASIGLVRRPLPGTAMGRGVAGRKYLVDYFTPMVPLRRQSDGQDMFTQFCQATDESGNYLSVDAIVDHMNFLMMAAHDTITSSMTSMVWLLAKNTEWQDRLRAEMLSVAPAGEGVGHNALGQLELTEMAIKETLRLVPPVPSIPRRAVKDFTFGGYNIPAGTTVGVSPSYTHRMPEYWPDPETFNPMRFTPEATRERHKFAWVPFGGGAHMCLGLHFAYMQTKIVLHHLLTINRVSVADGYEPAWQNFPIPKPKDGLMVTFERL
ncbi:MAG: cytochrome P450 [Pseudomonadota bacterium]